MANDTSQISGKLDHLQTCQANTDAVIAEQVAQIDNRLHQIGGFHSKLTNRLNTLAQTTDTNTEQLINLKAGHESTRSELTALNKARQTLSKDLSILDDRARKEFAKLEKVYEQLRNSFNANNKALSKRVHQLAEKLQNTERKLQQDSVKLTKPLERPEVNR